MMNEQQWRQTWDIYRTARELPDAEQRAYVRSQQADPEILAEVTAMLDDPGEGPASMVGRTFGRYQIVDVLGSGGMGHVYLGRDTELDRMVAVKFLSPDMAASRTAVERLIREAKSASALNHPHIVTVYEVIHAGDEVAIAMELVEGKPLRSFAGKAVEAAAVIQWGRQIAQALAAAHQRGIVHRDIKPENLMVRRDGIVKVLDFGLARHADAAAGQATNSLGLLAGSLNYMAPEQTRGEAASSAGDVFSLGIVLYELSTGVHPFRAASPIDTAHAIAHAAPKQPSSVNPAISPALNGLLLAMLDKTAAKRPSVIEVDRRLSELSSTPAGKPSSTRLVVAAAAVVAIALAAAAVVRDRSVAPKQPVMQQLTAQVLENRVMAAAISPDGRNLAFAAFRGSVFIRRMSDGASRALPTPDGLRVDRITWFPDGSKLLVSGSLGASGTPAGDHPAVWTMPADGGAVEKIVSDGKDGVPSPDGSRVAFTSDDGSILWLAAADGSDPRQVRSGGASTSFSTPIWSPDGKRLAYQRSDLIAGLGATKSDRLQYVVNQYRYRYESLDVGTRQVVASVDDVVMLSACGTADGRVLFLRWPTTKLLSYQQVWEMRTDPQTGAIRGKPRRLTADENSMWSSISASRDGKQVVAVRSLDSLANIYLADLPPAGEPPGLRDLRRLTYSAAEEYPHAWTADSRSVIFESNRAGHFDLYRQAIDRREAEPLVISPATKVMAHVTGDGLWLLFRELPQKDNWKVMRAPVGGGTPEAVLLNVDMKSEFRCGLRPGAPCVIRSVENDQFVFRELDPLRGVGRELARTGWSPLIVGDWDLSPDGKQVAIPNHDASDAKIRVVALDPARAGNAEETLTLAGLKNLSGVVWASDGQGWYVSVYAAPGGLLTYVDLHGQITNLLDSRSPTFAVPSPDGRHIAFPDWNVASNAWLLEGM